jgi:hypothetical protein
MTRATVNGLRRLVRPEDVAQLRGKTVAEILPISQAVEAASDAERPASEAAETAAAAQPEEASE